MSETFIIIYVEFSCPMLIEIHILLIQPFCESCFHVIAQKPVVTEVLTLVLGRDGYNQVQDQGSVLSSLELHWCRYYIICKFIFLCFVV
jgi:hypothetical protein